jgi:hypothetical protein
LPNEKRQNDSGNMVQIDKPTRQVSLLKPNESGNISHRQVANLDQYKTFRFDEVFDPNSTQEQVYSEAAFTLVEDSFQGYNGTVFAYG